MPGSANTTPTVPTRPSTAAPRSPPTTGSPRFRPPSGNSSTCGCPRLWSPALPAAPRAHRHLSSPHPPLATGSAARWSSTGWCRRRGTCGWPGGSFGSALPRAGTVIRFWADCQLIHICAGGARIKTLRSHLSVNDLAKLAATGAVPAGPAPLPPAEDGQAVEIERPVSRGGLVCLGPHRLLAAEILGGQLVGIR